MLTTSPIISHLFYYSAAVLIRGAVANLEGEILTKEAESGTGQFHVKVAMSLHEALCPLLLAISMILG